MGDIVLLLGAGVACIGLGALFVSLARRQYPFLRRDKGPVKSKAGVRVVGFAGIAVGVAVCVLAFYLLWESRQPLMP